MLRDVVSRVGAGVPELRRRQEFLCQNRDIAQIFEGSHWEV